MWKPSDGSLALKGGEKLLRPIDYQWENIIVISHVPKDYQIRCYERWMRIRPKEYFE